MMRLLSLEWKKFKNNAVVTLFGVMFLITMPFTIFMYESVGKLPPPLPQIEDIYSFPGIWEYEAYVGSWLVFFFLGFIVMYMVTSEVGFKTMRQNIITGLTRREFFMSKLGVILILATISTIIYTIVCLVFGFCYNDPMSLDGAFNKESMLYIFKFFLMNMGYMSFGFMIAMLIRKSGIAIFFYVTYIIFIEMILKWGVHGKMLQDTEYMNTINYWPMNAIEDLTPNPMFRFGDNLPAAGKSMDSFLLTDNHAIIASTIFISIFLAIAYYNFMKRDI